MTGCIDGFGGEFRRQAIYMHRRYMTDMVLELSRDYFVARPFLVRLITPRWKVGGSCGCVAASTGSSCYACNACLRLPSGAAGRT